MIKISVIVPIYNMEQYIGECLDSIFNQTIIKEIEIICVDDGSTDGSLNVLMKYQHKYDNIIVFHQENQGAGPAKNKGIMNAHGKYVAFMDPDDYYANTDTLEQLYCYAEKENVLACGGNMVLFYENGETEKRDDWFYENRKVIFQNYGNLCNYTCYIFNLQMLHENRILFPPYRRYEDPPFMLRVMSHIKEFYAIKETVYMYRIGHKELCFTQPIVVDILQGVRDCFQMAAEMNLLKVYDQYLKSYLINYLPYFYPYLGKNSKEAWGVIDEINEISQSWIGECNEIFLDSEHLEAYILGIKKDRDDMRRRCREAQETVIYGAGKIGYSFLEKYGSECRNIVGFAVTSKSEEDHFIAGYMVREIENYDRGALVVVAVGEKSAQEIRQNLRMLQFQNVCYVKYSELILLERLEKYLL